MRNLLLRPLMRNMLLRLLLKNVNTLQNTALLIDDSLTDVFSGNDVSVNTIAIRPTQIVMMFRTPIPLGFWTPKTTLNKHSVFRSQARLKCLRDPISGPKNIIRFPYAGCKPLAKHILTNPSPLRSPKKQPLTTLPETWCTNFVL